MKCNDCGSTDFKISGSGRSDVCPECFDLRLKLMAGVRSGFVHMDEFRQLQHVIQNGRGEAANAIRRALGLTAPEI